MTCFMHTFENSLLFITGSLENWNIGSLDLYNNGCSLTNSTQTASSLITSAEEGGYVFGSVCLSVCLSVCPSDYSQTCERILTKFFVGVGHGSRTK